MNCCVVPLGIDGFAGVTAIDTGVAGATVKVVLPVTPAELALIWEVPCAAPVARPPAVMVATALWKSGIFPRWSGVPFALGFALYIPQFFGTQSIRVAHGALVAVGCLWIAATLWQQRAKESSRSRAPA